MLASKFVRGCPCSALPGRYGIASCDTCGQVFHVTQLLRNKQGKLRRVPCSSGGPFFSGIVSAAQQARDKKGTYTTPSFIT